MSLAHANGSDGSRSNGYKLSIDGYALRGDNRNHTAIPEASAFMKSDTGRRNKSGGADGEHRGGDNRVKNAGVANSRSAPGQDAHLRAIIDTDFDPRIILQPIRDADGRIRDFLCIDVNEAACVYNGLTREELVGHRLLELYPNSEPFGVFAMYCRALEDGEALELRDLRYPHDLHGQTRLYNIRAFPADGQLHATMRDITDGNPSEGSPAADALAPRPSALERRRQRDLSAESQSQLHELQALTRSLIESREQEHQVISRELHDNIAQVLSAATARIALAQDEPIPVWLRQELLDLRDHLKAALADVRTLARGLRPSVFDHDGFAAALEKHAEAFRERTRISLEVTVVPEAVSFLGNGDLTHLFRLTQEALQNIEEHSRAANAWIDLWEHAGAMQLEIGDDGCAFTAERVAEAQRDGHLGLLGMRERAELLGGTFLLEAVPGQGTVIRIAIPPPPQNPRRKRR